jgi:hypothetical protein
MNHGEGLVEIGEEALMSCRSINENEIVIPLAVTAQFMTGFYECTQITTVLLGQGLEMIGEAAFCGCISLLEMICIPPNVKMIKSRAFYQCTQLISVRLEEGLD